LIAVEPYGSKANDKYQSSLATDLTVEIYRLWGGAYWHCPFHKSIITVFKD